MNTNLKLSFRALWAKKSFSLLNIFGLAIGIGTSLLIFLVIRNEISYDSWQSKKDRIHRVVTTYTKKSNGEITNRHTMAVRPLANSLRQTYPGIEKVGVTQDIGDAQIYIPQQNGDEKRLKERGGEQFFVDREVFDIFDFTWIAGNAQELNAPNTVVLNETRAKAYFGSVAAAMGKTFEMWSYRVPLRVVGVFKDLPRNTDIPMQMCVSFITLVDMYDVERRAAFTNDWVSLAGGSQCWVLLRSGTSATTLDAQLPKFVGTHFIDKTGAETTNLSIALQPLTAMHLDPDFNLEYTSRLGQRELWALALIGIFLLLVACINFVNLATAQSVTRAKEVGVRKALGCDRSLLLKQFLSETAIITGIAMMVGVLIAGFTLPVLSRVIDKPIQVDWQQLPVIVSFLLVTGVVVTFLAGLYPAMVLSGYNPVVALKSRININQRKNGISLRRGLVVFQFVIAQLLVIGTLVVVKQMNYFRNQSMGFQKDAVMLVDLPSDSLLSTKHRYLESRIAALPGVNHVTLASNKPSSRSGYYSNLFFANRPNAEQFGVKRLSVDSGYYKTFDLKLAAGRYPFHNDSLREVLVNEVTVKKLGLKSNEEIIGKLVAFDSKGPYVPVVGVLADFHNNPLNEEIAPAVVTTQYGFSMLAVRMEPSKLLATSKLVRETFVEVYPTYLYDSSFMDEDIARFYQSEAMIELLFKIFAFLGIFISCLGLYGLISFMAVQKTKEVGIRKVLGASVQSILYLFSKEFTILIGIAFLVAAPLGYYFMQQWLSGYYYHTDMGWGIFLLAVLLSVVIAWVTVGYKAVKAALANPVKSLKSE